MRDGAGVDNAKVGSLATFSIAIADTRQALADKLRFVLVHLAAKRNGAKDCGLLISDCGLMRCVDEFFHESAIPNPKSAIHSTASSVAFIEPLQPATSVSLP